MGKNKKRKGPKFSLVEEMKKREQFKKDLKVVDGPDFRKVAERRQERIKAEEAYERRRMEYWKIAYKMQNDKEREL